MTQPTKPKSKIPEFKSYEEEAEFWDTHDLTDFWDEFKPVKVRFAKNLSTGVTVRMSPEVSAKLHAKAAKKGVGPSTLVRMWILEHLDQEKHADKKR